jgi:hypothetical protein
MYRLIHGVRPLVRPSVKLCIAESNNCNRRVETLVGLTKRKKAHKLGSRGRYFHGKFVARGKTRLKSLLRERKNTSLGKNSKYFVYSYTGNEYSEKTLR